MQILGKRSKILLIVVALVMLVAVGISFAMWDLSAVKATNGDLSTYANAKVGDIVEFGRYYQTGKRVNNDENGEYEKTPIEWIVVDKDERTGQLTLMSKYILACGSYFGNWYYNTLDAWGAHYDGDSGVGGISYNQAYVDSTVRAYLNNVERLDMGGDAFSAIVGYIPSAKHSTYDKTDKDVFAQGTGLLSSVGFSNRRYWTGLSYATDAGKALVDAGNKGFTKRSNENNNEIYYQRPIDLPDQTESTIYQKRPATKGFYDEAFTNEDKSMIVPKAIAGYIGHRWPDKVYDVSTKSYVEGTVDKVWIPSTTELNVMEGQDWDGDLNDAWTNPSDEAGSTVFQYFKNYKEYGFSSVADAIKTKRTIFAENSYAMNYSIPVYNQGTTEELGSTDGTKDKKINEEKNSSDNYWTRSALSYLFNRARLVNDSGLFHAWSTYDSNVGVRPCVIIKY